MTKKKRQLKRIFKMNGDFCVNLKFYRFSVISPLCKTNMSHNIENYFDNHFFVPFCFFFFSFFIGSKRKGKRCLAAVVAVIGFVFRPWSHSTCDISIDLGDELFSIVEDNKYVQLMHALWTKLKIFKSDDLSCICMLFVFQLAIIPEITRKI